MKILLYFEKQNALRQSGIGRALSHQKKALECAQVEYTLNPEDEVDLVHINTLFNQSYRVLKKFHKKNIKVIVHGHSTKEDFCNSFRGWKVIRPFFYHMMLKMYKNADHIITPTPYSKKLISSYEGITCPISAISNGICLEDYKYNEENVEKFKKFFNFTDEKVIIGIGLFFDRKGILDFFETASLMPDVKFIWFGNLARYMTQPAILKAIANKPSNVIMPGYIAGDIINGAFHYAKAFFFPTKEETEGIVILEALASKLPIVTRDIGAFYPWLVHNQNALLGKNVEEFKKHLEFILQNDTTNLCDAGYLTVEERSIEKIGEQLKNLYESILKKE